VAAGGGAFFVAATGAARVAARGAFFATGAGVDMQSPVLGLTERRPAAGAAVSTTCLVSVFRPRLGMTRTKCRWKNLIAFS
jgi:hypothetical protein